jgi:uncharacterized protein with NAD-binding domain and iron-sulfur cluster
MSSPNKRQTVIVVGGGVAGLTVAHELAERNFQVRLYERQPQFGGKAASRRVRVQGEDRCFPAEHGFRFFPGWYRHVRETMTRIPIRGPRNRARATEHSVADHLVKTDSNILARYEREPIELLIYAPKNLMQATEVARFVQQLAAAGLPARDVAAFLRRIVDFVRTPQNRRETELDAVSWWDFVGVEGRSEAFRDLVLGTTRTLLAAKAEEVSAYTIALLAVRTLFDSPLQSDCVLDGPTSEVWINHWVEYLEGIGVEFHREQELEAIAFEREAPRIECLWFQSVTSSLRIRSLRAMQAAQDTKTAKDAMRDFCRYSKEQSLVNKEELNHQSKAQGRAARTTLALLRNLLRVVAPNCVHDDCANARREPHTVEALVSAIARHSYDDKNVSLERLKSIARELIAQGYEDDQLERAEADYYVFALPVEQMAYYVNRSPTMTMHDPSLRNIVKLTASTDWMAGIQFYLRAPVSIAPGHIVCADTEWALTAIEQTQFWQDVDLPLNVRSILSVDISAWDRRGHFNRREAFRCTSEEIALEVWKQLKESFNRPGRTDTLRDELLITGTVNGSFHLDNNIVDRLDRKKQAAFARGIDTSLRRASGVVRSSQELLDAAAKNPDAPFVFGDTLQMNVEPLLINRPGTLALRPSVETRIANMFLAADYVKTSTNLACMEGANEAGRLAANAILESAASDFPQCPIWSLQDGELFVRVGALAGFFERLPGADLSRDAAGAAFDAASTFAGQAFQKLTSLWKRP